MLTNKTIWITGATSGMGLELATQLHKMGNHVIASGRNENQLNALKQSSSSIDTLPFDISSASSSDSIRKKLEQITDTLDIVIVCAGVCEYIDQGKLDSALFRRVFDVNYFGALSCIEAALPLLEKSSLRQIVAISSQSVLASMPRAEAYGASKAALEYTLEALRHDLAHRKIAISIVRPGFIKTPLTDKNDFPMPFLLSAEEAARRTISGIEKGKRMNEFPRRLSWLLKILNAPPFKLFNFIAPKMVRTEEF